ncbi:MAG: DNA primase large subunit PriL [Candidatus Thermoplasmatota archaeon]|jgi:DNA primase large subunit|nr:DNA primase large subunit PriL [Candidatus Thermoplasmatota archaeon]
MIELLTLSKYPFLNASKKYVTENNLSIEELLTDPLYERARVRGIERLDNAFNKKDVGNYSLVTETDCLMELLSYPISRMIAVCIDDVYFKRRYALGESVHAYKNLINEPTTFLINIVKEFKLNVKYFYDTNKLGIYFVDYLRNAPTRYKEWKMINRDMDKGYIIISHKDLARIIQEALRNRINEELDNRICDSTVSMVFSSDITRIKNMVIKHRKNIQTAPLGKLDYKKLPPCIKNILSAIQSGENVPHMGRFALVSFLHALKLSNKEILDQFATAPDFEEEKTRYQIEHITGSSSSTSYKPPGCDKMRTYGICPVEEIDELCKKKKHPLSYYIAKWSQEKENK